MSAQVIAALRRRADVLDGKAKDTLTAGDNALASTFFSRLAAEFRALADDAEGHGGALEPDTRTGDRQ